MTSAIPVRCSTDWAMSLRMQLQRSLSGFEPWPLWYRYDALPTELWASECNCKDLFHFFKHYVVSSLARQKWLTSSGGSNCSQSSLESLHVLSHAVPVSRPHQLWYFFRFSPSVAVVAPVQVPAAEAPVAPSVTFAALAHELHGWPSL